MLKAIIPTKIYKITKSIYNRLTILDWTQSWENCFRLCNVPYFKYKSLDKLSLFAFASIIGGGIANVYDRIVYGSVTDFFFIDLGGMFRTGIFNMADLFVTTGMIILLFVSLGKKKTT